MLKRVIALALLGVILTSAINVQIAFAGNPFGIPLPFKRVESNPNKEYFLSDSNGPWLIMCASFAGEAGLQQAKDLVLELRRDHKLNAYMFKHRFDYSGTLEGKGWTLDQDHMPTIQRMKYRNYNDFEEIAVLVGDFEDLNSPKAQKALEKVKYIWPKTLTVSETTKTSQRFAVWRELQRRIHPDKERKKKGQMASAFLTPNPMLPDEYFNPNGPDKFILDLNRNIEFSLLKCPKQYSVRVASFRGESSLNLSDNEETGSDFSINRLLGKGKESKLAEGADKAHRLAVALRSKGIEAYEYHDRSESIVCIGSFDWLLQRGDGRTIKDKTNPGVAKIVRQYGAIRQDLPGLPGAIRSKSLPELPDVLFDITPLPMEVPRYSVGSDYARN